MFSFQFDYPDYLLLLPFVLGGGVFLTGQLLWRRHRALRDIPGYAAHCFSLPLEALRGILLMFVLAAAIVGAAGPRAQMVEKIPVKEGMVIIAGLDCSLSMLAPARKHKAGEQGSLETRLDIILASVDQLFRALVYDKKGFVCFAQNVFASKTASTDYERVIKPQLDKVNWRYIEVVGSGTNFAAAVNGCYGLFDTDPHRRNVCLILSDGEPMGDRRQLDENLAAAVDQIQAKLKNRRMQATFYLVGVGDTAHKFAIPRFDSAGNFAGYLTNRDGSLVKTQPDEAYLRDIAKAMQGTFVHIDTPEDLTQTLRVIINKERKLIEYRNNIVLKDVSWLPLVVMLAGIVLWFFLPKRIFSKRIQEKRPSQ